jgi:hypothetical protein
MQIPNILEDVEQSLKQEARVLPHKSNWASVLSDKCLRRLVYYRTDWDKQLPPEPYLQGIFNTGNRLEAETKHILNGIGMHAQPRWELVDTGVALNDKFLKDNQIGGEPDVFLKVWPPTGNGERPHIAGPVEIKSVNPNIFQQIHDLDSFRKYPWMIRYLGQLTLYELGSNFNTGWFLLVNKTNWYDYKLIEFPLDMAFAETLIKKAEAVNKHVAEETLPEKINDPDECPRCCFAPHCCPEYGTGGNMTVVTNEELEGVLVRLKELTPTAEELKELEKHRDALLTKGQDIVIGDFIVTWTHIEGVKKASPGGPYEQWRKKIVCTKE